MYMYKSHDPNVWIVNFKLATGIKKKVSRYRYWVEIGIHGKAATSEKDKV